LPPDVVFEGKNAPNLILAKAPTQTPLGELTTLPKPPSWISGVLLLREGGGEGKRGGREGINLPNGCLKNLAALQMQ